MDAQKTRELQKNLFLGVGEGEKICKVVMTPFLKSDNKLFLNLLR